MNNMDKARLIVERLNAKGADLRGVPTGIIAQVLDEIDAANDPYMPTNEEWAEYPWAISATTDASGAMWLYDGEPVATRKNGIWNCVCENSCFLKLAAPPADFRTTLRLRPEGI